MSTNVFDILPCEVSGSEDLEVQTCYHVRTCKMWQNFVWPLKLPTDSPTAILLKQSKKLLNSRFQPKSCPNQQKEPSVYWLTLATYHILLTNLCCISECGGSIFSLSLLVSVSIDLCLGVANFNPWAVLIGFSHAVDSGWSCSITLHMQKLHHGI